MFDDNDEKRDHNDTPEVTLDAVPEPPPSEDDIEEEEIRNVDEYIHFIPFYEKSIPHLKQSAMSLYEQQCGDETDIYGENLDVREGVTLIMVADSTNTNYIGRCIPYQELYFRLTKREPMFEWNSYYNTAMKNKPVFRLLEPYIDHKSAQLALAFNTLSLSRIDAWQSEVSLEYLGFMVILKTFGNLYRYKEVIFCNNVL